MPCISISAGVGACWAWGRAPLAMAPSSASSTRTSSLNSRTKSLVMMFYNIWFWDDLEVEPRMAAIGRLIDEHQPHVICLQEVTFGIYSIFRKSSWWRRYKCSVSESLSSERPYFVIQLSRLPVKAFHRNAYSNSVMGRDLCIAELDAGGGKKLVVATSHLESPSPTNDQTYSDKRILQARIAFKHLEDIPNVVFGGNMNWNDRLEGAPPLPEGWADAWLQLRPQEDGSTLRRQSNSTIGDNVHQGQRLDRVFCHLTDFKLQDIQIIGRNPIPGLSYEKEEAVVDGEVQRSTQLVFPSDHFGLLLKVTYEVPPEKQRSSERASFLCCCQAP